MTLSFETSHRFLDAAEEWSDARLVDIEEALSVKAEQALLEIEHLVSGATEVEFSVEDGRIHHEPSQELETYLKAQASETGLDESTVLKLHVDLFAPAFSDEDLTRPPDAPPK